MCIACTRFIEWAGGEGRTLVMLSLCARRGGVVGGSRGLSTRRPFLHDRYSADTAFARAEPALFWGSKASQYVDWFQRPEAVYDAQRGLWFPGATLNVAHEALDKHVEQGRGGLLALRWHSAYLEDADRDYTYRELRDEVSCAAAVLRSLGVRTGSRVLIYMPMVPEAAMTMLACARLGAPHCVVFGGFAADQLASRIAHTKPDLVVAASCGLEPGKVVSYAPLVARALERSGHTCRVLMLERGVAGVDVGPHQLHAADWATEMRAHRSQALVPPVPVPSDAPLYYLHTSGTTGAPKALVRPSGSHVVMLRHSMESIYGVGVGHVMAAMSDIGWYVLMALERSALTLFVR